MVNINHTLPDDVESLKKLVIEERLRYKLLEEKFKLLQKKFFGKRSEKLTIEDELQGRLFNEAEDGSENEEALSADKDASITDETITIKEYTRKKSGRKQLSEDLFREEVIHDITEEEKKCPLCEESRPFIKDEISEELEIIPAKIHVLRHIKKVYGPCKCDGFLHSAKSEIISGKMPERFIPGSIVSPGLLAYTAVSKFADALPFYRLSKIFERVGIDISRATMCNWMMEASEKMKDFFNLFEKEVKSGSFIQMDETTIQVLNEEGKNPESKSYMWVAIGYPLRSRPLILYQYHPTRSGNIPSTFLEDFKGYLQTDGYGGYNGIDKKENIIHVGCFAHSRRYFFEASKLNKKDSRAHKALLFIRRLYEIETKLREKNIPDESFILSRKEGAEPVLKDFYEWLVKTESEIIPESKTGKAVSYTLKEWSKLIRYLDKAFLTPDNNAVERAIRPFVIGRKNWLFSNTPRGACASARMYSLIESAKANSLEPYAYLRYLFSKLPGTKDADSMKKLLPCYIEKDQILSI